MNFHQRLVSLCRVSEILVQILHLILCSFLRVSGNWDSFVLRVILFYRLQKVCKVANEISNEPFVYTVLGCLLCKYHFSHSFSYLWNALVIYFTLVPRYQACIQKCDVNRVHQRSALALLEGRTGSSWKCRGAQALLIGLTVISCKSLVTP